MKRLILMTGLLFLAAPVFAVSATILMPNSQAKVSASASTLMGLWPSYGIDSTGNTGNGMTVNCPSCPGGSSGATSSVTISAVAVGVSISVNNLNSLTQAASATYEALSTPAAITLSSAYSQLITFAAGTSGPCEYCISSLGPSASFYYAWSNSATPPALFGSLYAVSTTPICKKDLAPNTWLHLSVTAAALTCTVKVVYSVKH